jgi:hypothetical protein
MKNSLEMETLNQTIHLDVSIKEKIKNNSFIVSTQEKDDFFAAPKTSRNQTNNNSKLDLDNCYFKIKPSKYLFAENKPKNQYLRNQRGISPVYDTMISILNKALEIQIKSGATAINFSSPKPSNS